MATKKKWLARPTHQALLFSNRPDLYKSRGAVVTATRAIGQQTSSLTMLLSPGLVGTARHS